MAVNLKQAKKYISASPKTFGVYYFVDQNGIVLYVGKAKRLENRVKSYFLKSLNRGPVIEQMVLLAKEIKYTRTESEIEAVFLEAELIKKLRPKYNVSLKDDKSFNLIYISKEKYPCVSLLRSKEKQVKKSLEGHFFGPYPASLALKKSIQILRKIFMFRDCSNTKYQTCQRRNRPCLYNDIKLCTAPCVNRISEKEYKNNIKYFKYFLRGKKKQIIKNLIKDMKLSSKNNDFEKAATNRDKISVLNHLHEVAVGLRDDTFNSPKVLFKRIECFDISNISGLYAVGAMSVITNGKIDTNEYRKFKIKTVSLANDLAMIAEILKRRFKNNWSKPDLIIIDGGVNHLNIARKILNDIKLDIPIISIAKGVKRNKDEFYYSDTNLAKYIKNTPEMQKYLILARNEAHRFAVSYYRMLHKKGMYQ